ncbi:multiple sugar transport system ATP-binding protein [Roseateles sp. YR242]|uniref:ABC transporter ATP-binding protein n=1 Tax=Roseateles sp. YR242 TaxID=1855305 RepID=UPI0008B6107A|nr:sn-glycerol-3-phosphate ABC transporter ATP-binding protein UgpC [Roseateles sp. YR242]SEL36717.1 multiple sugar transport system ATP-binding protein [Roseateles sp. YR242]
MAALKLEQICKRYGAVQVIPDLSLDVAPGEFIVFLGPSGCGKTSLLRMIAGLEEVTGGRILIGGEDVTQAPPGQRQLAMVFQHYALYPHMTVRENLAFGLRNVNVAEAEINRRITEAARMLELDALLARKPGQLSGGQRQRVAIGRAVVKEPAIFLFDEPLSNLDAALRGRTRLELAQLHRRLGATMVFVTHDQIEAMTLATRIVVMNAGRIEQVAAPAELYRRPATRFVAGFIGTPGMNFLQVRRLGDREGRVAVLLPGGQELVTQVAGPDLAGRELALGIRPEHLVVNARGPLPGTVEIVEFLGERTLAHIRVADGTLVVATVPEQGGAPSLAAGQSVQLALTIAETHLFDAQGLAHHASEREEVAA